MYQIKNIILDLGGVLINLDYSATEKKFKQFGLSNFNQLFTQAKQISLFDHFETGQLSEECFINELIQLSGNQLTKEQIIEAWNAMLLDFPINRIELIEQLNKKYRVFLFSNTNSIHIKSFKKILNNSFGYNRFINGFEKVYYSFEIGRRKPNVESFNFILEFNNLTPHETLFIDDSIQHIEGAKQCGIRALHLNTHETDIINFVQNLQLI
jgi:putative hydrolase of the HAD superfamily